MGIIFPVCPVSGAIVRATILEKTVHIGDTVKFPSGRLFRNEIFDRPTESGSPSVNHLYNWPIALDRLAGSMRYFKIDSAFYELSAI